MRKFFQMVFLSMLFPKKEIIFVVIDVKVAWVKQQTDKKNFRLQENMGWEVLKIQDVEETDQKLEELIQKQYDTIIISNELSYFSEDIIRKYQKKDDVNIIINFR